jgi:hypothetical protein
MTNTAIQIETETPAAIRFELYSYNPRRRQRGVEAAQVKVVEGFDEYLLWMSPKDIQDNLKEHGESKGLRAALEAYRINAMPPVTT